MSFSPSQALVWCEIPVSDLEAAQKFYQAVFDYPTKRNDEGPNPMIDLLTDMNATAGHLYPGKPAAPGTGPTVHLVVPDTVEAAMERVKAAGGTVVMDMVVDIPPGRFGYATDPDGNSIGLFQPKAA